MAPGCSSRKNAGKSSMTNSERTGLPHREDSQSILVQKEGEGPICRTHQDLDFCVPRAACCPCGTVALADKLNTVREIFPASRLGPVLLPFGVREHRSRFG